MSLAMVPKKMPVFQYDHQKPSTDGSPAAEFLPVQRYWFEKTRAFKIKPAHLSLTVVLPLLDKMKEAESRLNYECDGR